MVPHGMSVKSEGRNVESRASIYRLNLLGHSVGLNLYCFHLFSPKRLFCYIKIFPSI